MLPQQPQSPVEASSTSLFVGYSPPSSSAPRVDVLVADALQTLWRRQLQSSTSSSLLLPLCGRNATAGNPYLEQQAAASGAWTLRAPSRSREVIESARTATAPRQFHLYVDLDGVLCDFERGVRSIFPEMTEAMSLQDLERHDMWKRIATQSSFFRNLPWAKGGQELWDAVRHLEPDILTGVPASFEASRVEKFDWCARELFGLDGGGGVRDVDRDDPNGRGKVDKGHRLRNGKVEHVDMAGQFFQHARVNKSPAILRHTPFRHRNHPRQLSAAGEHRRQQRVITCWSSNKHHESRPGAVLIDDCLRLRDDWERKGGIFVHHKTGDVDRTLQQLVDLGIISDRQ